MCKTKTVLIICTLFLVNIIQSKAQCTIDFTQNVSGIYPAVLPDGVAGQPYDVDVTFVMLTDTLGLTIYNYQISGIVGLPIGITWQCSNFQNGCNYDPATSLYGCVKLSGTPIVPGSFTMSITVIADVQLVGNQVISFDRPLTILPGTVSNPGFSMFNSVGCAPLTVDFINNNPGQTGYLWEFDNGLQSTLENPPSQTYTTPGTYVITQTVTPNTTPSWYLTDITVTSIPNNYGGIADDPDMYFLMYDPQGNQVYDSRPDIDGTFPPVSWPMPNIPLSNGNYSVHVWDEDGGLFGADDDLGIVTFAGNGASGTATGTVNGASGLLIVDYTIFQTPVVPLVATDTIYVYAEPIVPVISASGPLVLCEGDSLSLSITDTVNQVQWYEAGIIMAGETSNIHIPAFSGSYSVIITSTEGCTSASTAVAVAINALPQKPTFFINGNVFTTSVTGVNFQWFLNGAPITGATGSSFTASQNGTYQLCASDSNGCINCSDTLAYIGLGLVENSLNHFGIYPNPSNGRFTLIFNDNATRERMLKITDMRGQVIEEKSIGNESTYVHHAKLIPGIYFISIKERNREYYSKLVVN